jgi:hypothetical protein
MAFEVTKTPVVVVTFRDEAGQTWSHRHDGVDALRSGVEGDRGVP